MLGFGRQRLRLWIAVLLPGLLWRALIPVGFMPTFGPGFSVQLMLCEGYAPVPATRMAMSMGSSMDMPMDMPMDVPAHRGIPVHDDHHACPYGASPAFAATAAWGGLPPFMQRSTALRVSAPQVAHFAIVARAQSQRGPPLPI